MRFTYTIKSLHPESGTIRIIYAPADRSLGKTPFNMRLDFSRPVDPEKLHDAIVRAAPVQEWERILVARRQPVDETLQAQVGKGRAVAPDEYQRLVPKPGSNEVIL